MKYYDVVFHELNGKSVVKRNVPSEKNYFDVWQDACASYTDKEIRLVLNKGLHVILNRRYVVSMTIEEVEDPISKDLKRKDEIMGVVNTLSNMGF